MSLIAIDIDPTRTTQSRNYCEQLTRHAAKNFYYALKLLPEPKRSAMYALYAYMRLVDDIADDEDGRSPQQRAEELEAWRLQTHAVLDGHSPQDASHDVWPAFAEMMRSYRIPTSVFDDMIAGQQQDLHPIIFDTFDQLRQYCCRVAGTVGLASIYIWGFEGGTETEALAVDRGIAFQLTNILRDLREDLARQRLYLPRQELTAVGLTEEDLRSARADQPFQEFMRFQIERAQNYYARSMGLENRIQRDSRPALSAMTGIYHGLLDKIAASPKRVFHERVSLSLLSKLLIAWRAVRAQE
ncbi:MAG TPA: phytoene/squalene synthase family protein [Tepidisphaeraceae bacterium]|nr:phytoene/squalene synthase family protein [Tepidisphaeraceae bacterium]